MHDCVCETYFEDVCVCSRCLIILISVKADSHLSAVWLRFTVRDFQYNEEEMKADKEEMTRLSTDKKKQFVCLLLTSVTLCVVSGARSVQKELLL